MIYPQNALMNRNFNTFSQARTMSQITSLGASVFIEILFACEYETLYPAFNSADLNNTIEGVSHLTIDI